MKIHVEKLVRCPKVYQVDYKVFSFILIYQAHSIRKMDIEIKEMKVI